MKVGFASNDWSRSALDKEGMPIMGGSGYIRIGQYVEPLKALGVSVASGVLAFDNKSKKFGIHEWDNVNHFDCDVIVMQRFMHKDALRDMRSAINSGQIILNDVDDWYWGLSQHNAAYKHTHPSHNQFENINHYKSILSESSGVITSTPFLQEKISQWNKNCLMHENHVNMSLFSKRKHEDNEKFVVGWMGSTAHRSGDLHILRGVASQITKFAKWHHTGHVEVPNVPVFWDEVKIEAGSVTRTPFLPPTQLGEGIKFDVGVVPLTRIPFNNAKSWIKGIEYAAAGVPFIASPSAEYLRLNKEYGMGTIAKKDGDFVKHVKNLSKASVRQEIADSNYETVKKLDVSIGAEKLIDTIQRLMK